MSSEWAQAKPEDLVIRPEGFLMDRQHRVIRILEDGPELFCAWQTGGNYPDTPPEYCDLEKDTPDEEYCPIHNEKAATLEALDTEKGTSA